MEKKNIRSFTLEELVARSDSNAAVGMIRQAMLETERT